MYNNKFTTAYNLTLSAEGGYANNPSDRGGETYKGIARKFWPDWVGWDIIDDYKKRVHPIRLNEILNHNAELEFYTNEFYYLNFWQPLNLDEFDQLVANEVYDTAVNQGLKTGAEFLQQALNLLNNNEKHYSDINQDGNIGGATIKAYKAFMLTSFFPGRSAQKNIASLLKAINGLQFTRYLKIIEQTPAQEVFFYGWLNRV